MPAKNTVKEFIPQAYYHVYNRGIEKRVIFCDDQDYTVFLGLLKKYLIGDNHNINNRHKFTPMSGRIELLAYCLMPNHFHLLIYQEDRRAMTELMRRVTTGYVMYFNDKYDREGRLFQGTYKASAINSDSYLHHISRYIHLNPKEYTTWPYSSYTIYAGKKKVKWVNTVRVTELFSSREEYLKFVGDWRSAKDQESGLVYQLAE